MHPACYTLFPAETLREGVPDVVAVRSAAYNL